MDVHRRLFPLTIVVVALAACGDDQPATSPTDATSTVVAPTTEATTSSTIAPTSTTSVDTTTATATTTTEAPMTTSSVPDGIPMVEQAIDDLAGRLAVDPDAIEVVSAEEVTWPDGSIGCPQPGMVYTQALVNGTLIRLAVDGIQYEYHAGRGGDPFYCPADRATPPTDGVAPNS